MFSNNRINRLISFALVILMFISIIPPKQAMADTEEPTIHFDLKDALNSNGPNAKIYFGNTETRSLNGYRQESLTITRTQFNDDWEIMPLALAVVSYDVENYVFRGWSVNGGEPVLTGDAKALGLDVTGIHHYVDGMDGTYVRTNREIVDFVSLSELKSAGIEIVSELGIFPDAWDPIEESYIIKPIFVPKKSDSQYELTVEATEGGTVDKLPVEGETWELVSLANNGYKFVGWRQENTGEIVSNKATYEVSLSEDTTYTAVFAKASIQLGDSFTVYRNGIGGSRLFDFQELPGEIAFVGQRALVNVDYSIDASFTNNTNFHFKIYAGQDTSGQLLADVNGDIYGFKAGERKYASIVMDPVPSTMQITIVAQVNNGEWVAKTYDVSFKPSQDKELTYLTTPNSHPPSSYTEDFGPSILDMVSYVDEETGKLDVYAAANGGVLKLNGSRFEFMEGLNLSSGANEYQMSMVVAIGGTKEHMTAVVKDIESLGWDGAIEHTSLYEYTPATKKWTQVEKSEIMDDKLKLNASENALVVASNDVWLPSAHWNGENWIAHEYNFEKFVNSRNGHIYALANPKSDSSVAAGIYQYNDGKWTEMELGSSQKLFNITQDGQVSVGNKTGFQLRNAQGLLEPLVNIESVVSIDSNLSKMKFNIDRAGHFYLIDDSLRSYSEQGSTLAKGHALYKFDSKDKQWIHQSVAAFNAPNEALEGTQDYLHKKVRPTTINTIYNLSDKMSIYAGSAGAVYADFDQTTIKFNSNGGTAVASLSATINSAVNAPTAPTKEGQYFGGWYIDDKLTTAYSFDYMPAKDIELYAKWSEKPVDLTSAKALASDTVKETYKKYNKRDYSDEGWSELTKAKDDGVATINAITGTLDEVTTAMNKTLEAMRAVALNPNITVAVSMEKFTLGQGYIIEPTLVTVPRNTQASKVITDLLVTKHGAEPLPYKMTGNITTDFYLAHVLDDGNKSAYKVPTYITEAIKEDGKQINLENDEWLGEFDFFENSGWMYAVNDAFPGVGAAGWTLQNDQVMRWQYTIYGLGADLNANNKEFGGKSIVTTAQKDNLTWRVAEINSLSAEEKKAFLAKDDNQAHYDNAYKVLTNMESTQAEVDAVLKALGGTERVGKEVKVEMPEEAQVINDAIKALPENITLTSKDAVEKVRKQYEALDPTLKQWIWKDEMTILEAAEKKIALLIEKVAEVEKQIESLPTADKIKLTDEDKYYEVQTAYIGLSSDQQKLVSNAKKLIELMTKLEQLKDEQVTVEKVIEQITALPKVENLKLTDEAAVTKVQAAYNKLTKDDQSKVTNAKTLTALVEKLAQLKASDNQKLASDVVILINGLPSLSTVKLTNESTIQAVKTAYDNLSADAKKLVTNVFILNAVVAKLNELKQEETDKAAATKVTTLINNLPASASITLANKLNVSNARTNYNALTTTQKALILNLAKLIEAEAKITELEVNVKALVTEIAALPNAKDLTSNHEKLVKTLRETYNSLATTQKAEVTNYAKLVEIEAALAKLQKADGDPKVDEEKVEVPQKLEEALAAAKGIQSVKETNDSLIITSKANTTNVVLPNAFIEQIRTNKYETVQIENTNGVKIAISNSLVNDVLSKKSSLEVVVEQQKRGLDVALVEVLSNGIKRDLTTAGNYTKVTMPLNVLTGGTVASSNTIAKSEVKAIARLVDGEYKAVPHRIVNDEAIIYMNEAATYVPVNETITFKDIEKIGARADIEFLASRYVVYGTTESTYTPNKNITRAQFGVMIARALNLTATEETSIQDIKGKKYENEIQALYEAGITKVDNKFNPNAPLTREHAAAFMYRVMEYIQKEEVEAVKVSTFKDKASIGKEYMTAVATLQALEIMEGSNGKFSPKAHLTRAQMAKILRRTLEEVNMM